MFGRAPRPVRTFSDEPRRQSQNPRTSQGADLGRRSAPRLAPPPVRKCLEGRPGSSERFRASQSAARALVWVPDPPHVFPDRSSGSSENTRTGTPGASASQGARPNIPGRARAPIWGPLGPRLAPRLVRRCSDGHPGSAEHFRTSQGVTWRPGSAPMGC